MTEKPSQLFQYFYRIAERDARKYQNPAQALKLLDDYGSFVESYTGRSLSQQQMHRVAQAKTKLTEIALKLRKRKILEAMERPSSSLEFLLTLAAYHSMLRGQTEAQRGAH